MITAPTEQLDRVFGALADPTRRAILARLASGEATVTFLTRAVVAFAIVSSSAR